MSNSFRTETTLTAGGRTWKIHSLKELQESHPRVASLPYSHRILLENLLRTEDGRAVTRADIEGFLAHDPKSGAEREIAFTPARVLMQDFTGVPAVVDLAAMREAVTDMGGDPARINPLAPADLVIDHSVMVDAFGTAASVKSNADLEFERNKERYEFLRWGQTAFRDFRVVPPDTGICHQVNLEYLASVVFCNESTGFAYPDTLVGTDSHTTMINALGVLGWGVGGIEAEAALLGQPQSMLIPDVVGFRLHGKLPEGATATDVVLTVTQMLRKKGVVGKFVEYYGAGLDALSLPDRATIANMAPEYGATMGFFPVDDETLAYLRFTNRPKELIELVEAYAKHQGLFRTKGGPEPVYSDGVELNLADVVPSLAGPRRPQDRVALTEMKRNFRQSLASILEKETTTIDKAIVERWIGEGGNGGSHGEPCPPAQLGRLAHAVAVNDGRTRYELGHGDVVIAAITSCTNTSNPSVMLGAGLLAKKAVERGLTTRPWVKTSLAPGSKVVTDYLTEAGLLPYLEALGFHVVGYGCTTCIGNSGPLPEAVANAVTEGNLAVAAVISGNRNFEGRVHPQVRMNYLASPPLVVAYALAGDTDVDLSREPLGHDRSGTAVYLRDIWPSPEEVRMAMRSAVKADQFRKAYGEAFDGDANWKAIQIPDGKTFAWDPRSTYVRKPPFFENLPKRPSPTADIAGARVLALLGDSVTTDHISPAGNIAVNSPAARYLGENGVPTAEFNSYGARRGNHEVMMRGTFANIRLKNLLVPGVEGGVTVYLGSDATPGTTQVLSIYDAAMRYQANHTPLVVLGGAEYGTGSSRDWAAKGTLLLGVKAVITKSFERIHRSNLAGMGVLPLQFEAGQDAKSLGLTGRETFAIAGIAEGLAPKKKLAVTATDDAGTKTRFTVICRLDTPNEVDYYRHGGILQFVLRQMAG